MVNRRFINILVCAGIVISAAFTFTGCADNDQGKLHSGTYYLTDAQKKQLDTDDQGWATILVQRPCRVNMDAIGRDRINTHIFDSSLLGNSFYFNMFAESDMVDIAGLLDFGSEPFYIHKDIGASDVQLLWGFDRFHSIGDKNGAKRFYRIQSVYADANINLYVKLCEAYLNDGTELVAEFRDGRELVITDMSQVKSIISGFDKNDTYGISIFRKDELGQENLRLNYIPALKTIKVTSWEGDTVVFAAENTDRDDSVDIVEFSELSLPFYEYLSSAVVPKNLPVNGVTMMYGTDDSGAYHGRLDFEFIANEDQATQIIQFYARYYPDAVIKRNSIMLCSDEDEEFTLTVSNYEDKFKVLVYHRKNVD